MPQKNGHFEVEPSANEARNSLTTSKKSDDKSHRLPMRQFAPYSVGHVLNDMTAACWFSYLLYYLEKAQNLSSIEAGAVLFAGQIADGLATPVAGYLSDVSKGIPKLGLGRRKLWNLIGVIIVVFCFFFVFGACFACLLGLNSMIQKTIFFSVFAALFNVGWAAIQVSHMAMVPELSPHEGERARLNSSRYAFTVLSNVSVFLIMFTLLKLEGGDRDEAYKNPSLYTRLTIPVLVIGGLCSLIFLFGTKEQVVRDESGAPETHSLLGHDALTHATETMDIRVDAGSTASYGDEFGDPEDIRSTPKSSDESPVSPSVHIVQKKWYNWLSEGVFWRVMLVYSLVRLSLNVAQVYLSFFITDSLFMDEKALAALPLVAYIAQFCATLISKRVSDKVGPRKGITMAACLVIVASLSMAFLKERSSQTNVMYLTVFLLGLGLALAMVLSVNMEADLVDVHTDTAAFVYGACSLADKFISGIVIIMIQTFGETKYDEESGVRDKFVRVVFSTVPPVAIILGAIVAWTVNINKSDLARQRVRNLRANQAEDQDQPLLLEA